MSHKQDKYIILLKEMEDKFLNELKDLPEIDLNIDYNLNDFEALKTEQQSLKKALKDYQDNYEKEKNILERLNAESVSDNSTDENYEQVKLEQEKLTSGLESLKSKLEERENYLKSLKEKIVQTDKDLKGLVMPCLRKEYEVYKRFFPIKYNLNSAHNTVEGDILSSSKSNTIKFKFNKQTNSQYFISNAIWTQLGSSEEFM